MVENFNNKVDVSERCNAGIGSSVMWWRFVDLMWDLQSPNPRGAAEFRTSCHPRGQTGSPRGSGSIQGGEVVFVFIPSWDLLNPFNGVNTSSLPLQRFFRGSRDRRGWQRKKKKNPHPILAALV